MHVFHSLKEIKSASLPHTAVAIGNFDGCHLGHRKLIREVNRYADRESLLPAVLTFYPHPSQVLNPKTPSLRLQTLAEKLDRLEELGLEVIFVAPFNKEIVELGPQQFFDQFLVDALNAKAIFVGSDFRFGKNRSGDLATLKSLCKTKKISLHEEPDFSMGTRVSSSEIRKLLLGGKIEEANEMLGGSYLLSGQVVAGDNRGNRIGFRTANLEYPTEKLVPARGVYVTLTTVDEMLYPSVTNIGVRPTFESSQNPNIETHVLDFEEDLYGRTIQLEFLKKIRDEIKFESVESLKSQIAKDIAYAKDFFKK